LEGINALKQATLPPEEKLLPPGWKEKWSKSHKKPYYEIRDSKTGKILDWSWKFPSAKGGSSKKTKKRKSKKRSKKAKNGKRRTLRKR
jgi:hypothetical protein